MDYRAFAEISNSIEIIPSSTFHLLPRTPLRHYGPMNYLFLSIAIVSEVIATSALKACNGFTRLGPSILVILGYICAFCMLSLTLRTIPVGVAYAIWSGVGVALVTIVAWIVYGQRLDLPAIIGLSLIVAGVLVLNLFSKSAGHG